jgi:hypothetical protein
MSVLNNGTAYEEEWSDNKLIRRTPLPPEKCQIITAANDSPNYNGFRDQRPGKNSTSKPQPPPESIEEDQSAVLINKRNISKEVLPEVGQAENIEPIESIVPQMEDPHETEMQSEVGIHTILEDNLRSTQEGQYDTGEFASEFKSDLKEFGLETLSLIDQIEMLNSYNSSLLNKNRNDDLLIINLKEGNFYCYYEEWREEK